MALTVKGDVSFGRDVIIKGRVIIHNTGSAAAIIPAGTVVEKDLRL